MRPAAGDRWRRRPDRPCLVRLGRARLLSPLRHHLFYRLKAEPHYAIPVGLLEGADWLLDSEIFIEEQPAWYCFTHSRRQLTGTEALAEHDNRDSRPGFAPGRQP